MRDCVFLKLRAEFRVMEEPFVIIFPSDKRLD